MGRDATVHSNPDKFQPDRFAKDSIEGKNPYSYTPFR